MKVLKIRPEDINEEGYYKEYGRLTRASDTTVVISHRIKDIKFNRDTHIHSLDAPKTRVSVEGNFFVDGNVDVRNLEVTSHLRVAGHIWTQENVRAFGRIDAEKGISFEGEGAGLGSVEAGWTLRAPFVRAASAGAGTRLPRQGPMPDEGFIEADEIRVGRGQVQAKGRRPFTPRSEQFT